MCWRQRERFFTEHDENESQEKPDWMMVNQRAALAIQRG
jgi:hypothetical protein